MDVAVRGDLASCLTLRLAPATWLFAVARGFGIVDGMPIARAALGRLESECRHRTHGTARAQRLQHSHVAAGTLCGSLSRVNGALYLRTPGHDDFVPAACSLSAALVVRNRAYVAHAGSTAVYLLHEGHAVSLTHGDTFDDAPSPVLVRALGVAPALTFAVTSIVLECGDVLTLCGRAANGEEEVLRVRYEAADDMLPPREPRLWSRMLLRVRAMFRC